MPSPTGQFGRGDRLLRPSEFGRVSRDGRRAVEPGFVFLALQGPPGIGVGRRPRLGITVSRRVGAAVVRNRVKRRVREWFRKSRAQLQEGIDLVVIGRSGAARLSAQETEGVLCRLARRAGATKV